MKNKRMKRLSNKRKNMKRRSIKRKTMKNKRIIKKGGANKEHDDDLDEQLKEIEISDIVDASCGHTTFEQVENILKREKSHVPAKPRPQMRRSSLLASLVQTRPRPQMQPRVCPGAEPEPETDPDVVQTRPRPQMQPQPRSSIPQDQLSEALSELKKEILRNSGDIKRLENVFKLIGDINNQLSSQNIEIIKLKREIEGLK